MCVHYTFADAHQRDYYVRVVTDCVGGSSQYRHDAALDAMEYLQTGALRTTDEILAAFAALATLHPASSKEPPDDHQIPRHGGRRRGGSARAERLRRFGFRQQRAERRTDRQGAAPVLPAGSGTAAGPRHLLRRAGSAADDQHLRGSAAVQGGHRQAGAGTASRHRVDGVAGQQGVHLQAPRGREVPRRHAVHLGGGQGVLRPPARRQPGTGLHGRRRRFGDHPG